MEIKLFKAHFYNTAFTDSYLQNPATIAIPSNDELTIEESKTRWKYSKIEPAWNKQKNEHFSKKKEQIKSQITEIYINIF